MGTAYSLHASRNYSFDVDVHHMAYSPPDELVVHINTSSDDVSMFVTATQAAALLHELLRCEPVVEAAIKIDPVPFYGAARVIDALHAPAAGEPRQP